MRKKNSQKQNKEREHGHDVKRDNNNGKKTDVEGIECAMRWTE